MSFRFVLDGNVLTVVADGKPVAQYVPDNLRFSGNRLPPADFEHLGEVFREVSPDEYRRIWQAPRGRGRGQAGRSAGAARRSVKHG